MSDLRRHRPDFERVAALYLESPEAQHGDQEIAFYEAQEWWNLFVEESERRFEEDED